MASVAAEARTLKAASETPEEMLSESDANDRGPALRRAYVLYLQIVLLVVFWWASAIGVTMAIKTTVHPADETAKALFPYSFALTALTNGSAGFAAWIGSNVIPGPALPKLRRDEVLKIMSIALIQGVEIGCNNKVLEYLSMSGRTMLNSMNVLFMLATALCWRLERLGALRCVAVTLLTFGGVCQGVGSESEDQGASPGVTFTHLKGTLLLVFAMVIGCQRWALVQYVMQYSEPTSALGQMSKLRLLSFIMPITGFVCFVLSLVAEADAVKAEHWMQPMLAFNVLRIAAGVITLVFCELKLVQLTSALAVQVLATIHQIPIVLAGVIFFHEHISQYGLLGFGLCLPGALFYVMARRSDSSLKEFQPMKDDCEDSLQVDEEMLVIPALYGMHVSDLAAGPANECKSERSPTGTEKNAEGTGTPTRRSPQQAAAEICSAYKLSLS
jgi:drug/metabolite transporter (DMT)-like permease